MLQNPLLSGVLRSILHLSVSVSSISAFQLYQSAPFPRLRSGPTAVSGASRQKQIPSSSDLKKAATGILAAAQLTGAGLPSVASIGIIVAGFVASSQEGESAVMLAPGTTLPGQAYIDAGQAYSDYMVSIKRISASDVVSYATGIKLSDRQVLLPAHVIDSLSGFRPPERLAVLGGSDFYNPEYNITVASYVTHPSYISGSNSVGGSVYDMAIITTSTAMPGGYAELATEAIPNGTTITFAGYGMPGLSYVSATTYDGLLRAFQGISTDPISSFDDTIYGVTFAAPGIGLSLPGSGSPGDSGAAGFVNGNQVGFLATSNSGDNFTYGVDLTTAQARSFVLLNIPEPGASFLFVLGVGAAVAVRRRE